MTTLISVLTALVLLFGGAGATVFAAQDDLPGDALYGVKTASEDVRLTLSLSDAGDALLYQEYAERRVQEVLDLATKGRSDDIPLALERFEALIAEANLALSRLAAVDPVEAERLATRLQERLAAGLADLNQVRNEVNVRAQISIENAIRQAQPGVKLEFVGLVESIAPESWVVSGQTVAITTTTEIEDGILPGSLVKVHAVVQADTTLLAREIERFEAGGEFNFSGLVETMGDDSWTISGFQVAITATTVIEGDIALGDLVDVHTLVGADGSLNAWKIELLEKAGGDDFRYIGFVEAMTATQWTVDGRVVLIVSQTEIEDEIIVGDLVRVEGIVALDGTLIAREIRLHGDPSEPGNQNGNGNGNENQNGNGNQNQNGNGNGNENSNVNENENENSNVNENGNENSNANENGNENSNANENGNENSNANENSNENSNANENGNENSNANENGNENSNGNENGNENSNANENENENSNGNENENENSNVNENGNENSNGNENENENSNGNENENENSNSNENENGNGNGNENGGGNGNGG